MKLSVGILGSIVALGALTTGAFAQVTVVRQTGTVQQTTGLTGFSTEGDEMVGMNVTAFFTDNTSQTVAWAATGGSSGAANGTGWSLSQIGDTYGGDWTLSNSGIGISSLFVDAGTGDAVFDVSPPVGGSPGSANGLEFTLVSANRPITVTFSDAVAITPNPPVGDLFRTMKLDFGQQALTAGQSIVFEQDTDSLQITGDLTPRVPEPGTMALATVGLAAFGVIRRKRAR